MSTADDLNKAVVDSATKARSISADGQTVTRAPTSDAIEAAKFQGANDAIDAVSQGYWPFARILMVPPGAGGTPC